MPPKMILTFDIEEWYHANYDGFDYTQIESAEKRLDFLVPEILELLSKYNARATFFVLGEIARINPKIVKMIDEAGHPIASHGMSHRVLSKLNEDQIDNELCESKDILENLIGHEIYGYRAPCFSLRREQYDFLTESLHSNGYRYDSSIVPTRYIGGGFREFPAKPFVNENGLIEFPIGAWGICGYGFALSGGHFRFLPNNIIKAFTKSLHSNGNPVVFYLHPKDLDPTNPKLPMPWIYNAIHEFGTRKAQKKLEKIMPYYKFHAIEDLLIDANNFQIVENDNMEKEHKIGIK